ncbi:gliding motility-associated C-terminal domain-containing protein [Muricauda sp. 2012CJ35-5]|uniref:Gliding motility-associated C-terminal domain-containing protein n=1 Tax=Flagellimonas spongiicola TaxID=2942208 RepID=A0ABT0PSU1_9FLAO|nr:gliding motility-associated C-terminal domain-containing protein [Allomuricauda spongiicola]MCL6273523.1 gliding motility-associated C-terminal domain-containing protein [Allomuricauda spongiicola]
MFLSLLNSKSKTKYAIGATIILAGVLLGNAPGKASNATSNTALVAGLQVVLQGETVNWAGEKPGCEYVEYNILIINTGTNNESLTDFIIEDPGDPQFIVDMSSLSGDLNNNGIMEPTENWDLKARRVIEDIHITDQEISNWVTVTAQVVGAATGTTVSDTSHPTDFKGDEPTFTFVPCQGDSGISLIKTFELEGALGDSDGCAFIKYRFEVRHEGDLGDAYEPFALYDPSIPGFSPTLEFGDNGNDILDSGETWVFTETVPITASDIVTGQVVNQAFFEAVLYDSSPLVMGYDISDYENTTEDRPTVVDLTGCQPQFGLLKTGSIKDCKEIEYSYTVTNLSSNLTYANVTITDDNIEIIPAGPFGDVDNLNELEPGETWTFTAAYQLKEADLMAGSIGNGSEVALEVLEYPGFFFTDRSHPSDLFDDGPTISDLTVCVPGISLIKKEALDGNCENINYEFTVVNESQNNQELENLEITDPLITIPNLPDSGDSDLDNILDPDETWVFTASYAITATDLTNGQVDNQASISANVLGFPGIIVNDLSHPTDPTLDGDTTTDLSGCVPNINIIKTGTVDGTCTNIDYTFTVNNNGNVDLNIDSIEDPLLVAPPTYVSGDGNIIGVLEVGETWEYTASYPITATDLNNGQVNNRATVDAHVAAQPAITVSDESHPSDIALDDDTTTDLSGCVPNINILKTGAVDGTCTNINYTFNVNNNGNVELNIDSIDDLLLPVPPTYVSGDDDLDGLLDVGETWEYNASYPITATDLNNGQVDNRATVNAHMAAQPAITLSDESHPFDIAMDGDTTTSLLGCIPSITIVKSGVISQDCTTIDYTFVVANPGNQDLMDIEILDDKVTVPNTPDSGDFDDDGILDMGETWTYTASYLLTATDVNNGVVNNQATVEADAVSLPDVTVLDDSHPSDHLLDGMTVTDVTSCQVPRIGLIKQGQLSDLDQDDCDESILYTFTVLNNGNADLVNLELVDPLLMGIVAGPKTGSDDGDDGVLSIGETWTYESYYAITEQNQTDGDVTNQATVTAWTQGDVEVSDDSDDTSYDENDATQTLLSNTCVNTEVGIALIKLGYLTDLNDDECPEAITYSFIVSNRGSEPLNNIILEDNLLDAETEYTLSEGDDNSNGILDLGEEWTFTASYVLTAKDLETGYVENQAVVAAQSVVSQQSVLDFSDDNSFDENDTTRTTVIDGCDPDNPIDPEDPINQEFEVFTGITPNGDGINDFFRINGVENFPENSLKIFNRWGVLVYEAEGYGIGNNLFTGVSEGRATISQQRTLPSGTYFYTLKFDEENNPGQATYSGYLYINRD